MRVIPISADREADTEKARTELARLAGPELPFLIDPSRAILFSAQAAGMPTTIIYDREAARSRAYQAGLIGRAMKPSRFSKLCWRIKPELILPLDGGGGGEAAGGVRPLG